MEPENVLLVTPALSEKGQNKMKAPKALDFKAGATKKNGEQRGLIGTLVGTTIHLAIYPAKKVLYTLDCQDVQSIGNLARLVW